MRRCLFSASAAILALAAAAFLAWITVSALAGYCSDYGGSDDGAATMRAAAPVHAIAFVQDSDSGDWIDDFVCDIRVTDVVLALAAFFLVAIGAWQATQLSRAVAAASEAARAARSSAEAAQALLAGRDGARRDDETPSRMIRLD